MSKPPIANDLAEQAGYWVARLASGEIAQDELMACKAWLAQAPDHRLAFDRERALWQSLEGQRNAFASLPPRHRKPFTAWLRHWSPRKALAAATVAAGLVLVGPGLAVRLQADAMSGAGEVRDIALPDGSRAMLDSNAAITIRFAADERRIDLLRGSAWFAVKHGDKRPFRVKALGGVTQDVGTAFAVEGSDDHVTVGVTQGAVRVSAPLTPSGLPVQTAQRVRYTKGGAVERLAPVVAPIAPWRRGLIVINGLPLRDAIAQIARYRPGMTITLADTSQAGRVSGIFRIDGTDEALEVLAGMAGLRVMALPGGLTILRR